MNHYDREIKNSDGFAWQEKSVYALFRQQFSGSNLVRIQNLYMTLTLIESNISVPNYLFYVKTIQKYSGLTKDWIPTGLRILVAMNVITLITMRDPINRRPLGRTLKFSEKEARLMTPEEYQEIVEKKGVKEKEEEISRHPESRSRETRCRESRPRETGCYIKHNNNKNILSIKHNKDKKIRNLEASPRIDEDKEFSFDPGRTSSESKSKTLSSANYELFHPLFHYWNSMPNLTTHRFPASKEQGASATAHNTVKLLRLVMGGELYKKRTDQGVPVVNNVDLDLQTRRISIEEIKEQIKKLNDMHEPKYLPKNKVHLPKSFPLFLYDPYKLNQSFFYEHFNENLIEITPENTLELPPDTPKAILDKYLRIMPGKGMEGALVTLLKKMQKWYEEMDKRMGLVLKYGTKYESYFGSFNSFCDQHILHLKSYTFDLNPGFLKTDGAAWDRFMDWVQKEYGLDLNPSDAKRKGMLVARKRDMLKYFKVPLSSFPDDSLYTNEELEMIKNNKYRA